MDIRIPSPKHYENYHGSSPMVRSYLDLIEKAVGEACTSETLDILRISLLIAHPDEAAQGKFQPLESFDWRCGYAAVGVSGDFQRYHTGDDREKITVLSEMLRAAFAQVGKRRKAKFNGGLAAETVTQVTHTFLGNYLRN